MEQHKSRKRSIAYLVSIFCIIFIFVIAILLTQKIYEKAHVLYDYVADKVDNIEQHISSMDDDALPEISCSYDRSEPYEFDYSWVDENPKLIAHAMGGIEGKTYTNSCEAFELNYALGHRVFEVDFDLSDPELILIASHDYDTWLQYAGTSVDSEYNYENFVRTPLSDDLSSLDYRMVIDLLEKYPDAYIITDTKYTDFTHVHIAFSQLTDYALSTAPSVLDRIIPQIYHQEMLDWVMDIYPFNSVIFTLYQTQWTPEVVYEFCAKSGIRYVTFGDYLATPDVINLWSKLGIYIAVHTINDRGLADALLEQGVDAIYTDFLLPDDF